MWEASNNQPVQIFSPAECQEMREMEDKAGAAAGLIVHVCYSTYPSVFSSGARVDERGRGRGR